MDPLTLGLGIASGGVGLIGAGVNAWSTKKTNDTNLKIANQTNDTNRYLAEHQYSLAAADLERAGLSKTLAAGSAMTLPNQVTPTMSAPQFDASGFMSGIQVIKDLQEMSQSYDKTQAEIAYINAQTRNAEYDGIKKAFDNSILSDVWIDTHNQNLANIDYTRSNIMRNNTLNEVDLRAQSLKDFLGISQNELLLQQIQGAMIDNERGRYRNWYNQKFNTEIPTPNGVLGQFVPFVDQAKARYDDWFNRFKRDQEQKSQERARDKAYRDEVKQQKKLGGNQHNSGHF